LNKANKPPKIFFGWWTVLSCGIIGFLGIGFANMGFSVFFKPLAAELGFNRAVTSTASSIQSAVQGISGPVGGGASDRYGPRRVMIIGVIILALGCIMMYFIGPLWSFLLVWGLAIGGGASLGVTIISDRAIINWFVRKSGIAINTKFAIQALSGLLLLPVIAWLVTTQGWRVTYVIAGVIIAAVSLPLIWFFVRPHRPEYYGLLPDGMTEAAEVNQATSRGMVNQTEAEATEFTLKQAMKTSPYWLLIAVQYTTSLVMPMMSVHCIPFLTDRGIDPVQAAGMMGLMSTISIPARLVTGFVMDRLKTRNLRFLMALGNFAQAIGVTIFLANQSTATIYVWFILYGIGQGISQSVNLPLVARYFGRKAYGSIIGWAQTIALPMGLAAPVYIGWVYDTSGSYMPIIIMMAGLLAVAGVMTCFILPPKSPAQAAALI
jgi:sugar phosphate permease